MSKEMSFQECSGIINESIIKIKSQIRALYTRKETRDPDGPPYIKINRQEQWFNTISYQVYGTIGKLKRYFKERLKYYQSKHEIQAVQFFKYLLMDMEYRIENSREEILWGSYLYTLKRSNSESLDSD